METGTLDISGTCDGEVVTIVWTERGGPDVQPSNGADGYGSQLVIRSVTGQLGAPSLTTGLPKASSSLSP